MPAHSACFEELCARCFRAAEIGLLYGQRRYVIDRYVCVNYRSLVLERNSACLSDMETNLHKTCLVACRRQAGLSADAAELDDRDNKMVCKVGACAAQCLAAQVNFI